MAVSMVDSFLFGDVFGSEEMRKIFDDSSWLQRWLDVEAALAEAEATLGIIPKEAAAEIAKRANMHRLDPGKIKELSHRLGHPLMALIKVLQAECKDGAGEFVHWGATANDIMDTATVLQIKDALKIILGNLDEISRILAGLAEAHRDTIMVGRTHGQQALPITFGFKVAIWLHEILRHIDRLKEGRKRVLVGQLSGAVGTMASFGEDGPKVQRIMMKRLKLRIPDIAWHSARDRFAELVLTLGMVAATLGKIAKEITLLQTDEIGELEEPSTPGKISSTTMPNKKNPSISETIVALSKVIQTLSYQANETIRAEHERDLILIKCEWIYMPQFFVMFGAVLKHSIHVLSGLKVNEARMKTNLGITNGLILSEQIMLELARHLGRQKSHQLMKILTLRVLNENVPLEEVLLNDSEVSKYLSKVQLRSLLNPALYTGLSSVFVDECVGKLKQPKYENK